MNLSDTLKNMRKKRIFVLGDMIADVYLTGRISRISREAPVLVLEHMGERVVAGGAANVANNVATLGGMALASGVTGDDEHAAALTDILRGNGADTDGIIRDPKRPTVSKTRVIAGGRETVSQQVVRIDRESRQSLSPEAEDRVIDYFRRELPALDGAVISDYGSSTVTRKIADEIIVSCARERIPVVVDSRYSIRSFGGVSFVKQNDAELAAAFSTRFGTEEALREAGVRLLDELCARGVLVTRGEHGMTLFEPGTITDIPVTDKSEVYDVSGAGDTCVATFVLALAAGCAAVDAARLSNVASGIAVRKLGTATVSSFELAAAVSRQLE